MLCRFYSYKMRSSVHNINELTFTDVGSSEIFLWCKIAIISDNDIFQEIFIFYRSVPREVSIFDLSLLCITKFQDIRKNVINFIFLEYQVFIQIFLHYGNLQLSIYQFSKSLLRGFSISINNFRLNWLRRRWR